MRPDTTDKTASAGRRRKTPAPQDPCRTGPALETRGAGERPACKAASRSPTSRRPKAVGPRIEPVRYRGCPRVLALMVCLFVLLLLAGTISARYGTPVVSGAASRGTVPPSSYRSALLNTPDPVDNTSSLAVTGNAAGGKSFRGNIPYGSTTSFGGRLGSTSLDPFLRNSTTPEASSRGPLVSGSFYSPTATVPRIESGSTGLFAPGSPRIAAGVLQSPADPPVGTMLTPEIPPSQGWTGRGPVAGDTTAGSWVASSGRTSEEMRRLVAGEPDPALTDPGRTRQTRQVLTSQEYQRQLDQLQRDLDGVRTRASDFERDLGVGRQPLVGSALPLKSDDLPLPPISAETLRRIIRPESPMPPLPLMMNPPAGQDLPPAPTASLSDRPPASGLGELTLLTPGSALAGPRPEMLPPSRPETYSASSSVMPSASDLAAQVRRIDAIFTPQTGGTAAPSSGARENTLPALQRIDAVTRAFDAPAQLREQPLQAAAGRLPAPAPQVDLPVPSPEDLRAIIAKAPARTAAPPKAAAEAEPAPPEVAPAPPDAAALAKLETYLKSGQSQMRQGQPAQAAESFAMACIYDPRDARPQLGRSHALFAAGEYLGSATCLAKAIELDPPLSLAEMDLVEVVGGPDQFLLRIGDLQERAKATNAPGLQLLLAYIYQQMKRPDEARTAIQAAKQALPSSPAVRLLEHVIAGGSPR